MLVDVALQGSFGGKIPGLIHHVEIQTHVQGNFTQDAARPPRRALVVAKIDPKRERGCLGRSGWR